MVAVCRGGCLLGFGVDSARTLRTNLRSSLTKEAKSGESRKPAPKCLGTQTKVRIHLSTERWPKANSYKGITSGTFCACSGVARREPGWKSYWTSLESPNNVVDWCRPHSWTTWEDLQRRKGKILQNRRVKHTQEDVKLSLLPKVHQENISNP